MPIYVGRRQPDNFQFIHIVWFTTSGQTIDCFLLSSESTGFPNWTVDSQLLFLVAMELQIYFAAIETQTRQIVGKDLWIRINQLERATSARNIFFNSPSSRETTFWVQWRGALVGLLGFLCGLQDFAWFCFFKTKKLLFSKFPKFSLFKKIMIFHLNSHFSIDFNFKINPHATAPPVAPQVKLFLEKLAWD